MDKDFSTFSDEIYYKRNPFAKNNKIQIKKMFSTSFEKLKSLTARSLQENGWNTLNAFNWVDLSFLRDWQYSVTKCSLLNVF